MATIPFVKLSGASVHLDQPGVYVKYSHDPKQWEFLNQQALYMAECGPPFVEVLGIAHGRYWTREYVSAWMSDDLGDTLWKAKQSLAPLWNGPARYVDRNWIMAHRARVRELCEINHVEQFHVHYADMFERNVVENDHRLTVVRATHGDATLSNVVLKGTSMRWIDPIPPSLWLPAFKAVDLGKLLQSSHGWEHSINMLEPQERRDGVILQDESVVDMMAAHYFHCLCYLRILRYAQEGSHVHNYALAKIHELVYPH